MKNNEWINQEMYCRSTEAAFRHLARITLYELGLEASEVLPNYITDPVLSAIPEKFANNNLAVVVVFHKIWPEGNRNGTMDVKEAWKFLSGLIWSDFA